MMWWSEVSPAALPVESRVLLGAMTFSKFRIDLQQIE